MRTAAATIVSRSRFSLGRATARSFREHHAGVPFFLLLADEPHERIRAGAEPFTMLTLDALRIPEPCRFRFRYGEMQLSYAATPFLIAHLLGEGFEGVLFLKQETMVLDRLDPLFEMLRRHSVLLTPHLLDPPEGGGAFERERNVLRAGVYNGGVIGFSRCEEAVRVLEWWKARTWRWCLLDVEQGLHYEQRWLDFVPSLAPRCGIVRDPGVNVGHWNLPERRIALDGGLVTACGAPCRIFRFSGYDPDRPDRITRYNRTATVEQAGAAVASVFAHYQALLEECGWRETRSLPYAWDFFDNGERIPPAVRHLYRDLGEEATRFGDPFRTAGEDTFYDWLRRTNPRLLGK